MLAFRITRVPLWSVEHPATSLRAARDQVRLALFYPKEAPFVEDRAELSDYAHSGFDRGHMTLSGDMPRAGTQAQSFSVANMVPQAP